MAEIASTFQGVASALGAANQEAQINLGKSKLLLDQKTQQDQYGLGQKRLQLEQQSQQYAQHRDLLARADKQRGELMDLLSKTIEGAKQSGVDNATISKNIQPLVQPLKRLTKSSGLDDSTVDAQVATMLSRPAPDLSALSPGGGSSAAPAAQPAANSGAMPNLTSEDVTIGQPIDTPIAKTPQAQAEVDKLTMALVRLPADANPNARAAISIRLQDALKRQNPDLSFHNIKDENGNEHPVIFNKSTGQLTSPNGEPYVQPTGENSDAAAITKAIQEGRQPPVLTGLYKNTKVVQAALAKSGFNMAEAQLEWKSAQKQVQSLNGPQMVRYAGLAKSVINTIDEVRGLSKEMENTGIPLFNRARLQAYIQTQGNSANGQLAARYLAGINTLKEEFANLAQGGYAPTEAAWGLANQQINGDYGVKQLDASLTEVQRLLRYRMQGIPNFGTLGPNAPNRYFQGQPDQGHGEAAPSGGASIPPPPAGFVISTPGK